MQATNISYYVNVKKHWLGLEDSGTYPIQNAVQFSLEK